MESMQPSNDLDQTKQMEEIKIEVERFVLSRIKCGYYRGAYILHADLRNKSFLFSAKVMKKRC
ncbi:hypothetical protein DZB87_23850 [Bacillus sp. ALD]|nr:hypothetical protein DZB87_23850 [Bacillus sp. ALD]